MRKKPTKAQIPRSIINDIVPLCLDPDIDNLANDKNTHNHQEQSEVDRFQANRIGEQQSFQLPVERTKHAKHDERCGTEDPARDAPLGGVNTELPVQPRPFPGQRRSLIEDYGEVSPRLLLQQNSGGDETHVITWNPVDQIQHGVAQWKTQILFLMHD